MHDVIEFILEYIKKHGDSTESPKAEYFLTHMAGEKAAKAKPQIELFENDKDKKPEAAKK